MTSRPLSIAILACAGWAAASHALALGFGRLPEATTFGQPLDLAVPLRLDAGESLAAACVRAEVQLGAQRLPPGALQVSLEQRNGVRGELQLRLRSARLVQEPLVAVHLALGCGASVSRQFVVLADPLAAAPPAAAPPQPVARGPARPEHAPAAGPALRKTALAVPAEGPRAKPVAPEALLEAAARAVAAQDAALASAAQAASAAEAAAATAERRLAAMDKTLKAARDEAAAQGAAMEQMRQRLARSEDQGRTQWLLAAVAAALALLALWLAGRVRALQRKRRATPAAGSAKAEEAAPQTLPSVAVAAPVPPQAVPAPALDTAQTLARPVSVDELIDLEQQVEFFLVLGEAEAAVGLLMSHLRSSGGSSPLPYLKLLEIFRRRGDREAHERTRRRFGQRFDAAAPDWDADPEQGLQLLDYPAALHGLQAAWPRPLDAMAELENLLFRKRSGELFDLPAYRDVLTLYAVARDLHRQTDQPGAEVDVLLPLADRDGATTSIFDGLDAAANRPAAPVHPDASRPPLRATLR